MTKEEFQIGAEALRDHIVSIAKHYLGNTDEVVEIYSEDELNGLILVSYSNFIFENSSEDISSLFKKLECNG